MKECSFDCKYFDTKEIRQTCPAADIVARESALQYCREVFRDRKPPTQKQRQNSSKPKNSQFNFGNMVYNDLKTKPT